MKSDLKMSSSISALTVSVTFICIYLLWMDVGQYLELQKLHVRRSPTPPPSNKSSESYIFSPFKPVTVKLLMLPPTIQYLDEPLGYFTVKYSNVAQYFSPNFISFAGVGFALLSARFFMSESFKMRQVGVLLFKARDFMDALDGNIVREISSTHSTGQVANPKSIGWMIDGVCDGIADVIRFMALGVYLHKLFSNLKQSGDTAYTLLDSKLDLYNRLPLDNTSVTPNTWKSRIYEFWVKYRKPLELITLVGLQSLFSSLLWNFFMINYHLILETDLQDRFTESINYASLAVAQNRMLKSSGMWTICYFWRLVNPQTMTQIQLLSVMYGKEVELMTSIQILGYIPPAIVGLASYIHLMYTTAIITDSALIGIT